MASNSSAHGNDWNCTSYPLLQANPDIGGIGMLSSFIISAYMTLCCCIAKARIDHLRSMSFDNPTPKLDIWSFALGNTILSFSDQQVVVGVAVLIGGLSQLESGLDSYHWQTVINLAWFSAFTHILTLTALNAEDRSNKKIKKVRLVGMAILAMMLISLQYTVGWINGAVHDLGWTGGAFPPHFPAWCLFHPELRWQVDELSFSVQYNWLYVTFSILILVSSYLTRALLLFFENLREVLHWTTMFLKLDKLLNLLHRLGIPKIKSVESRLANMRGTGIGYRILRSAYTISLAYGQVLTSTILEYYWLTFALIWGTLRIFIARRQYKFTIFLYGQALINNTVPILSEEDTWGFGQVVSLLLIVLPFMGFYEAYCSPPEADSLKMKHEVGVQIYATTSLDSPTLPLMGSTGSYQNSTAINAFPSRIRHEIIHSPWFKNLVIVIYLHFAFLGAITLYLFPATNSGSYLANDLLVWMFLKIYLQLVAVGPGIFWVATLIFIDHDVQRRWDTSPLSKIPAKITLLFWAAVTLFLMAPPVGLFLYWLHFNLHQPL